MPSHTNILLGTTPLYHGIHDNLNFIVREDCLTLAEHLKANGYDTAAFVGAYPLDSRFGLAQGFDTYDDEYPHSHDKALTAFEKRSVDVIERTLEGIQNLGSPWFVWLHCYDPHLPYDPPGAGLKNSLRRGSGVYRFCFEQAFREKDQNLIQKSSESFKKAIEIDLDYPYPYFGLGKIYRQVGNLDGAIYCWKKATELLPDFDMALYNLGVAYLEKGDKVKALDCFLELKKKFFHKYTEKMRMKINELLTPA